MSRDWWFYEGVRGWRDRQFLEHRKLMARYARLEKQGHPLTKSQGRLIELSSRIITLLGEAMKSESPADERDGTVERRT